VTTALSIRHRRGSWREVRADALPEAANETLRPWAAGGARDFAAPAEDIAGKRLARTLGEEIAVADERRFSCRARSYAG
jgi:hypothetical protein